VDSGFYVYWLYTRRNLQLLITVSISLYSHCVNSSPADLSYSCVLLVPIRNLVCVLLAASLSHRYCIHYFELKTAFILAHTKLFCTALLYCCHSFYNRRTDHRKHLRLHCRHLCTAPLHRNGCYPSIVALLGRYLAMLRRPRYNI
jgi:hypothetical protein